MSIDGAAIVVSILVQCVRVIRQQQVAVVERLGKFRRTLDSGPHLLVPWIDRVRYMIDLREAVVPFPPQGVITEDNLMVNIDSAICANLSGNNVDQALKALKKKMQREGSFREMKRHVHYEKPSEKRARQKAEAVRRARKLARKRAQREGLIAAPKKPSR